MSLHIEAEKGDIAKTILLPGDPLRAKHVAENLLEDAVCYNRVRNMLGYTGSFHGKRVSIQGTGMGMPSVAIYATELIEEYGVEQLIRVGTCGTFRADVELGQVILVTGASGDSNAVRLKFGGLNFAATPDFSLLNKAYNAAQKLNIPTIQGGVFSTDSFYGGGAERWEVWSEHGVLACEMESQMLFTVAAGKGVRALSILTVSDNLATGKKSGLEERERSYNDMMRIALELA